MQGEHGERRRNGLRALFIVVMMVLVAAAAGGFAYNLGVSHGLALGAQASGEIERGARVGMYPYYGYYGWHPWGFGFGFGIFGPLLFIAFWFFLARLLFWGGPWRRYGYWRHRGAGRYGDGPRDLPPGFDEWHRRAHERMNL